MQAMPSSANRRRVEIPAYLFDKVKQIADVQQRTVASVVHEILLPGVWNYQASWLPSDREKLNRRAARALALAETEEPQRFNHNYVGTEHLLLGLISEGEGIAAQVLRDLGITHGAASEQVLSMVGRGDKLVSGTLDYAPRLRLVLGMSLREAHNLDHGTVGTGHLLLGLIREGKGIAAGAMVRLGVVPDRARTMVIQAFARGDIPISET